MRRNLGLKLVSFLVVFAVLIGSVGLSYAATTDDLKDQKQDVNQKINETKKQANEVKEQKEETKQEAQSIGDKIEDFENQIKTLDSQIGELNTSISDMQKQIDEKEEIYQKNKKLLEERLVALYEAGNTSFLDFILGSEDLTDFISKFALAEEVTSYDQELIDKVAKESKELEGLKNSLNTKLEDVQSKKSSRSSVVKQLAVAKGQKEEEAEKLGEKQEELEKDVEKFEEEAKSLDAKIAANQKALEKKFQEAKKKQEQQNANKNNGNNGNNGSSNNSSGGGSNSGESSGGGQTNSNGFIMPIKGYPVSTGWYYSSGKLHGAVDFSTRGKTGIPIYAVADGIVIFSGWGGANSYGNYVLIRHYNGLYTLYAHGSSLSVSTGQAVTQGQTIMLSGNTGNSTGPHLHFEVRTSSSYSSRVNPLNYLPK